MHLIHWPSSTPNRTTPQNPQRGSVTAAVGGAGPSRSREAASAKRWKALAARFKDGDGGAGPQLLMRRDDWEINGFSWTPAQEIKVS